MAEDDKLLVNRPFAMRLVRILVKKSKYEEQEHALKLSHTKVNNSATLWAFFGGANMSKHSSQRQVILYTASKRQNDQLHRITQHQRSKSKFKSTTHVWKTRCPVVVSLKQLSIKGVFRPAAYATLWVGSVPLFWHSSWTGKWHATCITYDQVQACACAIRFKLVLLRAPKEVHCRFRAGVATELLRSQQLLERTASVKPQVPRFGDWRLHDCEPGHGMDPGGVQTRGLHYSAGGIPARMTALKSRRSWQKHTTSRDGSPLQNKNVRHHLMWCWPAGSAPRDYRGVFLIRCLPKDRRVAACWGDMWDALAGMSWRHGPLGCPLPLQLRNPLRVPLFAFFPRNRGPSILFWGPRCFLRWGAKVDVERVYVLFLSLYFKTRLCDSCLRRFGPARPSPGRRFSVGPEGSGWSWNLQKGSVETADSADIVYNVSRLSPRLSLHHSSCLRSH